MLIKSFDNKFGIIWHLSHEVGGFQFGSINLIVDGKIIPDYFDSDYTINTVFGNLKSSVNEAYKSPLDIGDVDVRSTDIQDGVFEGLNCIEAADLSYTCSDIEYTGVLLEIGFSGNKERLFYSVDNGDSYSEVVLERGTVAEVINQLP